MGDGGGSRRGWGFSPASIWCWGYVEGVCRVCVVDGWFTASPGLSQTDWTLAGWGCTPGVHEQSWHPRINQPSTHTLVEEPPSWPVYHQLGEYHQPVNSNKHPVQHLPVSCVGGAQGKPLRWRVEERPCHSDVVRATEMSPWGSGPYGGLWKNSEKKVYCGNCKQTILREWSPTTVAVCARIIKPLTQNHRNSVVMVARLPIPPLTLWLAWQIFCFQQRKTTTKG